MGVEGLLKFVASKSRRINLSTLKNKKVDIDGYVWLHKAVFSGNFELARNADGYQFVYYFIRNINFLLEFGIIPIVVFDGDRLGNKNMEEDKRNFRRDEKQKLAKELMVKGKIEKSKRTYISSLDVI